MMNIERFHIIPDIISMKDKFRCIINNSLTFPKLKYSQSKNEKTPNLLNNNDLQRFCISILHNTNYRTFPILRNCEPKNQSI